MLSLTACITEPQINTGTVEGMKPVYIAEEDNFIAITDARSFGNLGKIVYAAPYLLINERFQGIHIVDNSDPANPIKLNFVQIPGNTDFTIKSGFLYANHGSDFKVLQLLPSEESLGLSDFTLVETCAIPEFFLSEESNSSIALFPPNYTGFFECVDPDKGIVISWEETTLIDPECKI